MKTGDKRGREKYKQGVTKREIRNATQQRKKEKKQKKEKKEKREKREKTKKRKKKNKQTKIYIQRRVREERMSR